MTCKDCVYAVKLSGAWCCDYLALTGHRRPCPPGEDCTVRKAANLTKKGSAFMKRRGWDTEKAKALYGQKLSDAEIAGKVGATASAVAYWRRGQGLPANHNYRSPPPSPVSPSGEALPGPIAFSVEYQGCALLIKASDIEGMRRIYEYAGKLLQDMSVTADWMKEAAIGE